MTMEGRAYAPYSHFSVGAALLGTDGVIYGGANVENSSYGLSMCAERNALFHAIGQGCQSFQAIAITSSSGELTRRMPAGHGRIFRAPHHLRAP